MFLIINMGNTKLQSALESSDFQKNLNRLDGFPGFVSLPLNINDHVTKEDLCQAAQDILEGLFPEKVLFTIGKGSTDAGPAITIEQGYNMALEGTKFDFVPALKVNGWPLEASNWIIRKRLHNWPSPELINDIVSQGYHLVNKHPHASWSRTKNGNELVNSWRFSFSLTEIMLARSFGTSQRQSVILMKMLKEKLPGNILSTYHVKTLVYWSFESMPEKYLVKDNLGKLFLYLIDKLICCLSTKVLSHYFLDSVNLFDGMSHDHLLTVLRQLLFYRKHPLDIFKRSLAGGLTSLSTSCMKDRKANLSKLGASHQERAIDSRYLTYQMCQDDSHQSFQERNQTTCKHTLFKEDISEVDPLNYNHYDEDNSATADCILDTIVDLQQEQTDCKKDIEMIYQLAKDRLSIFENRQKGTFDVDYQQELNFSEELLEHLTGILVDSADMKLLDEAVEDDTSRWLSLTLDANDFHEAVFTTLYDLCTINNKDMNIHYAIQGLLDGLQIIMDWALSQTTPKEEVIDYFDEAYMTTFLDKEAACDKVKLRRYWKNFKK